MSYCDCVGEFDGYERLRYWVMINACDVAFITATVEKRIQEAKIEAAKAKAKAGRRGG